MNEVNFIYFTQDSPTKATGHLRGDIGGEVSASLFVQELNFLESHGITEFDIRILSLGGSIIEGMAIYSALIKSKARITTYNDGLAASTAGWLFLAGSKAVMMDYALLMMHNPWSPGSSAKGQEVLNFMKNSIVTMLSGRSGLSPAKISAMMDEETWLDAATCQSLGLATDVEKTELLVQVDHQNMAREDLFQVMNSAANPTKKMEENKSEEVKAPEVTNAAPAPEVTPNTEAPEVTNQATGPAAQEVEPAEKPAAEVALELKNAELENSNKELLERLSALEASLNSYKEAEAKVTADAKALEVTNLVDSALQAGKISPEMKGDWVNLATTNFDLAKKTLGDMKDLGFKQAKNMMADVTKLAPGAHAEIPGYLNMQRENPRELNRIFQEERGLFNAMWKKEYGTEFQA